MRFLLLTILFLYTLAALAEDPCLTECPEEEDEQELPYLQFCPDDGDEDKVQLYNPSRDFYICYYAADQSPRIIIWELYPGKTTPCYTSIQKWACE